MRRNSVLSSLNSGGATRAANFKKAKNHVTLLACTNASGIHCLPLVFINKSAKPRCFKHMDMSTLPVRYYSQKKSWMDNSVFSEWFHQRFVPSVRRFFNENGLEKKALLLLDNAFCHIPHQKHCSQMMVPMQYSQYFACIML